MLCFLLNESRKCVDYRLHTLKSIIKLLKGIPQNFSLFSDDHQMKYQNIIEYKLKNEKVICDFFKVIDALLRKIKISQWN